ncbi:MAG TPA: amidohydrolase family protein [Tepidisphaeraceae bacterium]|nr:amidohydrolase family protein [Tepidisphaeraceae bacterium]
MAQTIDSHHHFWRYDPAEYDWIDQSMAVLRRDFLPEDLRTSINAAGIDGVVSVQARQTLEETRWLLSLAREHPFIRGVVGWAPLASPDLQRELDPLVGDANLVGLRHVVQGEPDDEFILRDDFNRGIDSLRAFGLCYDILIYERHLPQTIRFVDRHPGQVFVLDHVAKPNIRVREMEPWRRNIGELARREHVYCKLSGMVTEADPQHWSPAQLRPYYDAVLETFGPRRLMFGSDWPVCLLGVEYARWADIVREWTAALSHTERNQIFGGSAIEAYRLPAARPAANKPAK